MVLGPMNRFDTLPELQSQVKRGVAVYPLTGLQTTAVKVHMEQNNVHKFGQGTVTFTDAAAGKFNYSWHANDTNMPGIWDVWIEIIDPSGRIISSTNTEPLEIVDRIRGYAKYMMGRVGIEE